MKKKEVYHHQMMAALQDSPMEDIAGRNKGGI